MAEAEVTKKAPSVTAPQIPQSGTQTGTNTATASKSAQSSTQTRSVPLGKLSDADLLRGCRTQLEQLRDNSKSPIYYDQNTGKRRSQKVIDKVKSDVIRELNATISEIEGRMLVNPLSRKDGRDVSTEQGSKMLREAVASKDYKQAIALVDNALDRLEASFYQKSEPVKKSVSGLKAKRVPIDILGLASEVTQAKGAVANQLLIDVLDYAAEKGWIDKPKNGKWIDEAELKKISGDKLELVKEMLKHADGNGIDAMKTAFGALTATDAAGALAEWNAPKVTPEVPGTKDEYVSADVFKQDWRVVAAAKAMGGSVNYESYKVDGKYSVSSIVIAAGNAVEADNRKVNVDSPLKAQCENIEKLVKLDNKTALDIAVEAKIFYSGSTRAEVREAARKNGDNVSGEVFNVGDRFYALRSSAKVKENVPKELQKRVGKDNSGFDANVKAVGRAIAEAPLENKAVQNLIRKKIGENVTAIENATGSKVAEGSAVSNYLKGGELTDAVKAELGKLASAKQVKVTAARSVEELMYSSDPVYNAITEKKLGNAETLDMIAALNANGNLSAEKTIEAIRIYTPGKTTAKDVKDNQVEIISTPTQPSKKEPEVKEKPMTERAGYMKETRPEAYKLLTEKYADVVSSYESKYAALKTAYEDQKKTLPPVDAKKAIDVFLEGKTVISKDTNEASTLAGGILGNYEAVLLMGAVQ